MEDSGVENWASGNWSNAPWFTDAEEDVFTAMGFPLALRREAAAALKRVYTPEVCREIAADPKRGYGVVISLFQRGWPGLLVPLLEVGRDLAVVRPWDDESLLKRLTRCDTFADAAFELRVLASVARAGYVATRIPESPPARTPDIGVRVGLEDYELELKGVNDSPIDRAADEINQRLARARLFVPGLHLELRGSPSLSARAFEDLEGVVADTTRIVVAFKRCVRVIKEQGGHPGDYVAGDCGTIRAVKGPAGGSVTPVVLPDLPSTKRVNKLVRLVRDASRQFRIRRGVAVLAVRRSAELLDVGQAIKAAAAADPDAFAKCHMVVLVDDVRDPTREYGSIPLVLPVQVHSRRNLTRAQERLAAVVAGRCGRPASVVVPSRPGEGGLRIGTVRRAVTSVVIGADLKFDISRALPGATDV